MKYTFTVIALLLIGFNKQSVAEIQHPDTIRIEMPNHTTIEYRGTYDSKNYMAEDVDIVDLLSTFLKRWAVIKNTKLDQNKNFEIKCRPYNEYLTEKQIVVSIKEISAKTEVMFPLDEAIALTIRGRNRLELNSTIAIYFNTIDQLKELKEMDLKTVLKNADQKIHAKNENDYSEVPFTAWFKSDQNYQSNLLYQRNSRPFSNDQINIIGGTSIENTKGEWLGSAYLGLDLILGAKNEFKHCFSFRYEWMYDFSSGNKNINHWLVCGYANNTSWDSNKINWQGLEFGYLISRKGDLFNKDTFRLGSKQKIYGSLYVTPQIYFNKFFKDVIPSVKISVGF